MYQVAGLMGLQMKGYHCAVDESETEKQMFSEQLALPLQDCSNIPLSSRQILPDCSFV